MKRSEFINQVLNDISNTVFTTRDQVEVALDIFEKLGMLPPPSSFNIHTVDDQLGFVSEVTYDFPINKDYSINFWESENEKK